MWGAENGIFALAILTDLLGLKYIETHRWPDAYPIGLK